MPRPSIFTHGPHDPRRPSTLPSSIGRAPRNSARTHFSRSLRINKDMEAQRLARASEVVPKCVAWGGVEHMGNGESGLRPPGIRALNAIGALYQLRPVANRQLLKKCKDTLAEWLRRRPAKPMGSPRVGSNPIGVVCLPSFVLGPGAEGCTSHYMIFSQSL